MKIQKNIAARLHLFMKVEGVSVRDLSERTGIARSTLQGFLNGSTNPRTDTIELLAEGLGISPAQLITEPGLDMEELHRHLAHIHPQLQGVAEQLRNAVWELHMASERLYLQDTVSEAGLQREALWEITKV